MRYSRFKKQMDAATGNLPPPTPRKPRKNRVEKTKIVKKEKKHVGMKTEGDRDGEKEIKTEGKGKERERRIKSEYAIREGTGESLLSSSAASMSGSINRDTPDLEGGLSMMPSPAVSLAQHDLSSSLSHHHHGHSHGHGLGMSSFQPSSNMSFADAVQVKRERKPSAKSLNAGLFANMQGQGQAQSRSPHLMSEQLNFQMPMQNGTSSVSTSTHPSTPRMCIEDHEQTYSHSHPHEYSPHHDHIHDQSPHGHAYHHDLHTHPHDSFGLASLTNDDDHDREMDELLHSFGMPSSAYSNGHGHGTDLYSPLMAGGEFAFGMGVGVGGDGYDEFWGGNGMEEGESERMGGERGSGGTVVKKEERWEEAYRR